MLHTSIKNTTQPFVNVTLKRLTKLLLLQFIFYAYDQQMTKISNRYCTIRNIRNQNGRWNFLNSLLNFLIRRPTEAAYIDHDSSPIGAFCSHRSCMKLYRLSLTATWKRIKFSIYSYVCSAYQGTHLIGRRVKRALMIIAQCLQRDLHLFAHLFERRQ